MGLLDGKVAIVTGAGLGLGREHALELARQGAAVIVNDLGTSVAGEGQSRVADETVAAIEAAGGRAIADYADVGDYAAAAALIATTHDRFGRLDILVNNAGILRDGAIWNMSEADFDSVIRVHLKGSWALAHHAAKYWRQTAKDQGAAYGRIINTTSTVGLFGNFGQTNYVAAKAGIVGLTLALSLELARFGVTVNAISPGAGTRMMAGVAAAPQAAGAGAFDSADPACASPMVAWLASEQAAHVTGQVFHTVGDRIAWMHGWAPARAVHAGNRLWRADELGQVLGTKLFQTQAPGVAILKDFA